MIVEQEFISERGRRRKRLVPVDLGEVRRTLRPPTAVDLADWDQICGLLKASMGESAFAVWLAEARLIAVGESGRLVIAAAEGTEGWLTSRYGVVLDGCAARAGRELRLASVPELQALGAVGRGVEQSRKEVAG